MSGEIAVRIAIQRSRSTPLLREKLHQPLSHVIPKENLHTDNMVVHDIEDEMALGCVKRQASMPNPVTACRRGRRVHRCAEFVLASASVDKPKCSNFRREPGLFALAQKVFQLGKGSTVAIPCSTRAACAALGCGQAGRLQNIRRAGPAACGQSRRSCRRAATPKSLSSVSRILASCAARSMTISSEARGERSAMATTSNPVARNPRTTAKSQLSSARKRTRDAL